MQTTVHQADMSMYLQVPTPTTMMTIISNSTATEEEYNMCPTIHVNPLWNEHRIPHYDHHVLFRHVFGGLLYGFEVWQDDLITYLLSYGVLTVEATEDYKPYLHEKIKTYVDERNFFSRLGWEYWERNDMCNVESRYLDDRVQAFQLQYDLSTDTSFCHLVTQMLYKKFIFHHLQSNHGDDLKAINAMLNEHGDLSKDGINFRASVINNLPEVRVKNIGLDLFPEILDKFIIPVVRICSKLKKPQMVRRSRRKKEEASL